MEIKDFIDKIGKMDTKDFGLIIECGIIIAKLEKEEQDKLLEMIDLIIKKQKEANLNG